MAAAGGSTPFAVAAAFRGILLLVLIVATMHDDVEKASAGDRSSTAVEAPASGIGGCMLRTHGLRENRAAWCQ